MALVKFLSNGTDDASLSGWRRQLPDSLASINGSKFTFDPHCRDYDWLVVYDRFPSVSGERFSMWREELACPAENTLFITVEPSSIKFYEPGFLRQFGHILTGHEPWSIDQPGIIRSQPGLKWFYGDGGSVVKSLDTMLAESRPEKTRSIATVCSDKQQTHTLHQARYTFTQLLKKQIPELEIYGHGVRPMPDKAESVDPYRYHLAIENHRCDHHWTEKVSDAFLGWALPIYYGCTNLGEYFPEDSFVEIDITDFDASLETIQKTISAGEYERRLDAVSDARSLILTKYNLFAVIAGIVSGKDRPEPNHPPGGMILSRHALRAASIGNRLGYAYQKIRRKLQSSPRPS